MIKKLKKVFHVAIFFVILSLVLIKLTDIMEAKGSKNKYNTFFEESEDYDVIFFGTSLVINGVFPMKLYNDYGIASYNFGNHASQMPVTYHTILNCLEYVSPKLVVIDLYTIATKDKVFNNFSYAHTTFDTFSLSLKKYSSVNDLFENRDDKIEMLFTLSKYHSRWAALKKNDFVEEENINKGSEARINVYKDFNRPNIVDKDILPDESTVGMEYLEKAIKLCKSKEIEVLLTSVPRGASEKAQIYNNYGYVLAEKYNISYIDFEYEDVVNYNIDFYDSNGHLNPSGASKITSYLGDYITKNYSVPNIRNNELYSLWNNNYKKYVQKNINKLKSQKGINEYLMLLSDDEFECTISLSDTITKEKYSLVYELINNINGISKYGKTYSNVSDESKIISTSDETSDISIVVYSKGSGDFISRENFDVQESGKIVKK